MMSRLSPVAMSPGIAGVSWRPNRLWKNAAEDFEQSEILSVILLKLLPGHSVCEASSPVRRLWIASLNYISTFPGHTGILWGTTTHQDQENICLLIQWENPMQWRKFQMSMGLSLMLNVLGENPSNRCLRLSVPRFATAPQILQLISSTHRSDEEIDRLNDQWSRMKQTWELQGRYGELYSGRLEQDGAIPTRSEPDDLIDAMVKAQDNYFYVMTFKYQGEETNTDEVEGSTDKAEQSTGIKDHLPPGALIRKFQLSLIQSRSRTVERLSQSESENHQRADNFASLLQLSPRPHYSEHNGVNQNVDVVQAASIRAVAIHERLFPTPHGDYMQMGDINQYMNPVLPYSEENSGRLMADFVWFNFKLGVLDSDGLIKKTFLDFRWRIRDLEGCKNLIWGRSAEKPDECAMIIYWKNALARTSNSQFIHGATSYFMETTQSLIQAPQFFEIKSRSTASGTEYPLLEITTFDVPNDPLVKSLLGNFYDAFERTTKTNVHVGPPIETACSAKSYFFHEDNLSSALTSIANESSKGKDKSNDKIRFTSLMAWKSMEAMREWYKDFVAGCWSYERLGHKIDALRLVCGELNNVETRILSMGKDPLRVKVRDDSERGWHYI